MQTMTLHAILDLETVHDSEIPVPNDARQIGIDPGYPDSRWEIYDARPMPSPPGHRIVCAAMCILKDYRPTAFKIVALPPSSSSLVLNKQISEELQVRSLVKYLEEAKPILVTWNGRGFDIPVLQARSFKYGVSAPWWWNSRDTRYRYSTTGHIDLMDQLSDYGAGKRAQMQAYARMIGLPGKLPGEDGGKVMSMLEDPNGLERVRRYCLSDVFQETLLFLRFELLRGQMSAEEYRVHVDAFRFFVEGDGGPEARGVPLPPDFLGQVDWKRVALREDGPTDVTGVVA
jgi:3'-5' exonuclease